MTVFVTCLLLGAAAMILLLAALTVRQKWKRAVHVAARIEAETTLRPALVELMSHEDPVLDDLAEADGFGGRLSPFVDELAGGLMSKLRGADRDVLRTLLQQRGAFDRAVRDMQSARPNRRIRGVELLGNGEVSTAMAAMSALLSDRHLSVRKAAARAIGKLGEPESVPVLMHALVADNVPPTVVGMAILHLGPRAIEPLRTSLEAPDFVERRLAAECLGILGAIDAVEDLMSCAAREDVAAVSEAAVRALGRIGSPAATVGLTAVMATHVAASVREEAAIAIGRIGGENAIAELATAMADPAPAVVLAAAQGLRSAGGAGVDLLREYCDRDDLAGSYAREMLDISKASTPTGSTHTGLTPTASTPTEVVSA